MTAPTLFIPRKAVVSAPRHAHRCLALDPSSSRIGYAVLDDAKTVVEFGPITPERTADDANARIRHMAREARDVILDSGAGVVVVEDTSGKVGHGGRGRGMTGAGLAVHGKAVGYLMCLLDLLTVGDAPPFRVIFVAENVWTRGVKKDIRQRIVIDTYPTYREWVTAKAKPRASEKPRKSKFHPGDPGGDVSDALALCRWWHCEGKCKGGVA